MTRTAAHQARYKIEKMTTDKSMYTLINDIYNDFESQICQNCTWFNRIGACTNKDSLMNDQISVDDFGCNQFEPKH